MSALATPAQLGAYLQQTLSDSDPTALLMLDIASGMVRDYLMLDLDYVANDVVTLDPINSAFVLLPQLPVANVTKLETFDGTSWTIMDSSSYSVSNAIGMLAGKPNLGIKWPSEPQTWRVTYSHGYADMPKTIVGVVLGVAARFYAAPAAVESERIGDYSVKYGTTADGFTPIEKIALNKYKNPRIA